MKHLSLEPQQWHTLSLHCFGVASKITIGQIAAVRRKESQAPGSESVPYLMTYLSSAACPPRLNPSDPSSFPRSGFLMTVIQPKVSGWVLREQTLRWRLACKKSIRNVLRLNARRRKGKEIGLGRRRSATIPSQQRTCLTRALINRWMWVSWEGEWYNPVYFLYPS